MIMAMVHNEHGGDNCDGNSEHGADNASYTVSMVLIMAMVHSEHGGSNCDGDNW